MKMYTIVSERIGTPGDLFAPEEGTNVQALLDGGFIKPASRKAATTDSEEE